MNRQQLTILSASGVVLLAALILWYTGAIGFTGSTYADSERFTSGERDFTEPIRRLDVHWSNGLIRVEYHSGNTVELRETANRSLSEETRLHWWLDGETLHVQYAMSGARLPMGLRKELTLRLPEGMAFEDAGLFTASGNMEIPALRADTLTLGSSSGNIHAAADARAVTLSASSGNLDMHLNGDCELLTTSASSGNISIHAGDVRRLEAAASSGNIDLDVSGTGACSASTTSGNISARLGACGTVEFGSTSGNVTLALSSFSDLKASAVSGRITASLPEEPGFALKYRTVSGKRNFASFLSPQDDGYVCGDGSGTASLETVSGDIRVTGKE